MRKMKMTLKNKAKGDPATDRVAQTTEIEVQA
jgi:hypothetical protein